jgi:serine/threonine protein kinase
MTAQAKNIETGEMVAIKIVRKDFLDSKPSLRKKMRREISVLKLLSHPNVMSLIDVFEIETHLFLVMEFVDGLELFEFLVRRGALPASEALAFFHQIICGLEYCHRRLIVHRDLKPENLLLDRQLRLKIADFGMTSLNPPGSLLETSCGSPHYCDPMVVSGERYDGLKADIWSCGVILYAMVTGRLPFDDDNLQRLLLKVQAGQFHLPSDLPDDLRDLIKKMLTVDPEERITLEEIKAHPWFNMFPPKHYPQDDFRASADPIVNPDPNVIASLSDLGLGDRESITQLVSLHGASMEKVFYTQLQRHPLFGSKTAAAQARPAMPPPGELGPAPWPPPDVAAVASAGAKASPVGAAAAGAASAPVSAAGRGVTGSASWPGLVQEGTAAKGVLVRQSQIVRSSTNAAQGPDDDDETVEEAIQSGEQKSWFPALLDTLLDRRQAPRNDESRQ